jgi:hypothetical protein
VSSRPERSVVEGPAVSFVLTQTLKPSIFQVFLGTTKVVPDTKLDPHTDSLARHFKDGACGRTEENPQWLYESPLKWILPGTTSL